MDAPQIKEPHRKIERREVGLDRDGIFWKSVLPTSETKKNKNLATVWDSICITKDYSPLGIKNLGNFSQAIRFHFSDENLEQ